MPKTHKGRTKLRTAEITVEKENTPPLNSIAKQNFAMEECTPEKITAYISHTPRKSKAENSEDQKQETALNQSESLLSSSVLMTPEKTPVKTKSSAPLSPSRQCDSSDSSKKDSKVVQCLQNSPEFRTKTRKTGARKKSSKIKKVSEGGPTGPKSSKPKKTKETPNHLLTEYFPVRRSERKTRKDLKKEQELELEQAVLAGREDGLKVVDIEGKGRGVVATKPFKRGDFVVEYAGDLIDPDTAKNKEELYASNPDVGCYMYYFIYQNKKYCVDATAESGKLGRLLNHSSKCGNCMTKVIGIGDRPYLILLAARDIKIGEELVYDYGDRSKSSLEAHPWLKL